MGVKDMTFGRKQFGCLISAGVAARPPPMTPWKRLLTASARCTKALVIATTRTRLTSCFMSNFAKKTLPNLHLYVLFITFSVKGLAIDEAGIISKPDG
jgi:hypothetical protein